jgi:hypothetical protein
MLSRISVTPNIPIITTTRPKPSYNALIPNVNLGAPVKMSIPMDPKKNPKQAEMRDLIKDPSVRKHSMAIPAHIKEKYSVGPNSNPNLERGCATKLRTKIEKVPPINDPMADIPKAGPALPCLAI